MRIGFLEVVEVLAGRLEQAVDLKHMHARLRVLERHSLLDERRAEEIRKADRGRSCAQEQVALVLELGSLETRRVNHASEHNARHALHVIPIIFNNGWPLTDDLLAFIQS